MRKSLIAAVLIAALLSPTVAGACTYRRWCGHKHSKAYNRRAIRAMCAKRHLSKRDTKRMLWLAKRESGQRNLARNGSCKGLFQVMTKQPKWKWANPKWNTRRAIDYIRKRYGSVSAAVAHSKRYGWY